VTNAPAIFQTVPQRSCHGIAKKSTKEEGVILQCVEKISKSSTSFFGVLCSGIIVASRQKDMALKMTIFELHAPVLHFSPSFDRKKQNPKM